MANKKEEKVLEREKDGFILKEDEVKIVQITADGLGSVFGFGNDQKVYIWHYSSYYAGKWVIHVKPLNK